MNEAAMLAMEDKDKAIETSHFEKALKKIPSSVSVKVWEQIYCVCVCV